MSSRRHRSSQDLARDFAHLRRAPALLVACSRQRGSREATQVVPTKGLKGRVELHQGLLGSLRELCQGPYCVAAQNLIALRTGPRLDGTDTPTDTPTAEIKRDQQ
jgi:hypothetical protein